jgi:DNA-binding LacI/PurR family transcriptional regulator
LVTLGHQRLVYLRSVRTTEASADRERGVREALDTAGIPANSSWTWQGNDSDLASDQIRQWIAAGVTAFAAEDDMLGLRVMECASALGLACPADYSLAVLGNPLSPQIDVPNWMTFSIPRREMGREAFKLLESWLSGDTDSTQLPMRKTLSCTVSAGQTVRDLR